MILNATCEKLETRISEAKAEEGKPHKLNFNRIVYLNFSAIKTSSQKTG